MRSYVLSSSVKVAEHLALYRPAASFLVSSPNRASDPLSILRGMVMPRACLLFSYRYHAFTRNSSGLISLQIYRGAPPHPEIDAHKLVSSYIQPSQEVTVPISQELLDMLV